MTEGSVSGRASTSAVFGEMNSRKSASEPRDIKEPSKRE
jgi:hypothetical protein